MKIIRWDYKSTANANSEYITPTRLKGLNLQLFLLFLLPPDIPDSDLFFRSAVPSPTPTRWESTHFKWGSQKSRQRYWYSNKEEQNQSCDVNFYVEHASIYISIYLNLCNLIYLIYLIYLI